MRCTGLVGFLDGLLRGRIVGDADHASDLLHAQGPRGTASRLRYLLADRGQQQAYATRGLPGLQVFAVTVGVAESQGERHVVGSAAGCVLVHDLRHGARRELGSVLHDAFAQRAAETHAGIGCRVHGHGQLGDAGLGGERFHEPGPRGHVRVLHVSSARLAPAAGMTGAASIRRCANAAPGRTRRPARPGRRSGPPWRGCPAAWPCRRRSARAGRNGTGLRRYAARPSTCVSPRRGPPCCGARGP